MLPGVERHLRRATSTDAASAARIIRDALAGYGLPFEPEGRDADVKLFGARPEHDDFIAEIDGRAVGVASVGPHGDDGVAWVSKVFVAEEARRAGIGRALLAATHDAARARGYRRVGLRTRVVFREAIALYESDGYVAVARDPAVLESKTVDVGVLNVRPLETGDVTPVIGSRGSAEGGTRDVVYFRPL